MAYRKSESQRLQLMIVPTGSEYTLPKMHKDMEGKWQYCKGGCHQVDASDMFWKTSLLPTVFA